MAAGGGSGPTRGGYFALTFSTQILGSALTGAGWTLGTWTVPTGARFLIHDVQAHSEFSGSTGQAAARGRVNVLQGSTAVLSTEILLATGTSASGTLTQANVAVESAVVISATAAAGFGNLASSNAQHVTVTILGSLAKHPDSIFGNFGYAAPTTQPTTGI